MIHDNNESNLKSAVEFLRLSYHLIPKWPMQNSLIMERVLWILGVDGLLAIAKASYALKAWNLVPCPVSFRRDLCRRRQRSREFYLKFLLILRLYDTRFNFSILKKYCLMQNECVLELDESVLEVTHYLPKIRQHFPLIEFIFKTSLNKANQSSLKSARRISINECLIILEKLKK
jgi:hypothetical protein